MKKLFLTILFHFVIVFYSFSQSTSLLVSAFKSGNIESISAILNNNVELIIEPNNIDDTYVSGEAVNQIKLFLTEHKPTNFSIKHEGQQNGVKFIVGTLVTTSGTYRVVTSIKNNKINEINIEK